MSEYVGGPFVVEPVRGERYNIYADRVATGLNLGFLSRSSAPIGPKDTELAALRAEDERLRRYAERVAAALDFVEPVPLRSPTKPLPYVFPSPSLVPPGGDETVIGVLRQLLNARMITREQVLDFNLNLDADVWEREEATYAWYRRPSGATNRAENERLKTEIARLHDLVEKLVSVLADASGKQAASIARYAPTAFPLGRAVQPIGLSRNEPR